MISKSMSPRVENSSAIRAMFEEGLRMARIVGPENVYDFSLGNPNVPAPPEVNQAIIDVVKTEDPIKLHGYMVNSGFDETRQAVADDLNDRYGTKYGISNIVMSTGAAMCMNIIFRCILDIDDEVIVSAPYFVDYTNYVSNWHGKLEVLPANPEGGFMPRMDELEKRINKKTKAVIINNPNNPTGVIYPESVIKEIAAILEKKQKELGTVIYLIADEPYRELVYDGTQVPHIPDYYDNALVCYSYSKSLSLAGERIGYVVVPDRSDQAEQFKIALGIANRISGAINAPSLIQLALARCLRTKVDIDFYKRNGQDLYEALTDAGFDCLKPQGAFYLWMKSPDADEKAFVEALKEEHILVTPGSAFAGPGYVRFSYCVAHETIERATPGFKRIGQKYFH
ncbi:pyridoxal phosphate-dependent aminotransferase [Aminicella lysinilytica]|uniref:Aminotransferase n=1 Tax=Aminicella lysinilytica TaxID=433323 RepID=A0A4R6Q0G8_9FIRM|nr:pyridoxal phosphate-dependent aminotransferase [Aminicella lysinilytica]TDP54631.1 aspartate aminotransferase [Aminicella lysinilytica]